jgi:hypothetical protein
VPPVNNLKLASLQSLNGNLNILKYERGPFEKLVDWRQCAAVMQREAATVMPSFNGEGNVVVA